MCWRPLLGTIVAHRSSLFIRTFCLFNNNCVFTSMCVWSFLFFCLCYSSFGQIIINANIIVCVQIFIYIQFLILFDFRYIVVVLLGVVVVPHVKKVPYFASIDFLFLWDLFFSLMWECVCVNLRGFVGALTATCCYFCCFFRRPLPSRRRRWWYCWSPHAGTHASTNITRFLDDVSKWISITFLSYVCVWCV